MKEFAGKLKILFNENDLSDADATNCSTKTTFQMEQQIEFIEALKVLGIEDYAKTILNSNFHLVDYIILAKKLKNEKKCK